MRFNWFSGAMARCSSGDFTKDGNRPYYRILISPQETKDSHLFKEDCLVSGDSRWYYYNDKWQVTCQYDVVSGSETFRRCFVYGNYIDEVLLMKTPSQTYYYSHDHLYSPVVLVDAGGTPQERYEYDVYGSARIYDGTFSSTRAQPLASIGNPYLFTGREVDFLDSGSLPLQYNRHRYYSQSLGRWTSEDPLGIDPAGRLHGCIFSIHMQYVDGLGLYQYCTSSSVTALDPVGLKDYNPNGPIAPRPAVTGVGITVSSKTWLPEILWLFYLRLDGLRSDYAILDGDALEMMKGAASGDLAFVPNRLRFDALDMLENMSCDSTDTFIDRGRIQAYGGIAASGWNIVPWLALNNFAVYWEADCRIGPMKCCARSKNGRDYVSAAYYSCGIKWTLYDIYDFAPNDWNSRYGTPFHVFGYWYSGAGDIVESLKGG